MYCQVYRLYHLLRNANVRDQEAETGLSFLLGCWKTGIAFHNTKLLGRISNKTKTKKKTKNANREQL